MTINEQQNLHIIDWQVKQDSRLLNFAIFAKSVMQVNLRKAFTEQEWNLIMQDVVCETAMNKVVAEARRFLYETEIRAACFIVSPMNYNDLAKYIVGIAAATIIKEYKSKTILPDEELADIINKL